MDIARGRRGHMNCEGILFGGRELQVEEAVVREYRGSPTNVRRLCAFCFSGAALCSPVWVAAKAKKSR